MFTYLPWRNQNTLDVHELAPVVYEVNQTQTHRKRSVLIFLTICLIFLACYKSEIIARQRTFLLIKMPSIFR